MHYAPLRKRCLLHDASLFLRLCRNTDRSPIFSSTHFSPKCALVPGAPMSSHRDTGRYSSYTTTASRPCWVNRCVEHFLKPRSLQTQFLGCSLTAPLAPTSTHTGTTVHFTQWCFPSRTSILGSGLGLGLGERFERVRSGDRTQLRVTVRAKCAMLRWHRCSHAGEATEQG